MLVAMVGSDALAIITATTAGLVLGGHALAAIDRARKARRTDARVNDVHSLVNSRLDAALTKIKELQREVTQLKGERG